MSTYKPHSDSPTCQDNLDWLRPLAHISERIEHCETPHVLGIHGDWGSGKTSFMRQVQWCLGGSAPKDGSVVFTNPNLPPRGKALRKKIITIWFDAWRYQNEAVPVVALLQEMRQQMAGMPVVKERLKKYGTLVGYGVLENFSSIAKMIGMEGVVNVNVGDIEKRGEKWEKDHYADGIATNSIREHLQATIKNLLPGDDDARVVVFIDDLDRCNAKAAIRLLEGLKIYLSIPQCVFVLGMNERILVDALREELAAPKEAKADEMKLRAAHYLEKICTDIYRLPLPTSPLKLLKTWITNPAQAKALELAVGDSKCLPPNPRRLKALANQWPLFAACVDLPADEAARKDWAVRVLIASYIHQFNREMWERWHFNADFWEEIKKWCTTALVASPAPGANIPAWAESLKLTYETKDDASVSGRVTPQVQYHNPGDIEIFWIGSLIFAYPNLTAAEFEPLLVKHQTS